MNKRKNPEYTYIEESERELIFFSSYVSVSVVMFCRSSFTPPGSEKKRERVVLPVLCVRHLSLSLSLDIGGCMRRFDPVQPFLLSFGISFDLPSTCGAATGCDSRPTTPSLHPERKRESARDLLALIPQTSKTHTRE